MGGAWVAQLDKLPTGCQHRSGSQGREFKTRDGLSVGCGDYFKQTNKQMVLKI